MANEGQKFASDKFYDPLSETEGINGGRQFEGSDVMFADDVNKIVSNEIFLNNTKADKTHRHDSSSLDFDPADIGVVAANESITAATKCKITYDEKGLVTAGANLSNPDIPSGLIQGGDGVTVSRNAGTGVYTVSANKLKLVGYRYPQQGITLNKYSFTANYNTYDLTANRPKGAVQVLFLRLNQSNTGYTIDIPIEMLILMYHSQENMRILGEELSPYKMQITNCNVSRRNASHPYLDINITVNFTYELQVAGTGTGKWLRAEWWGRELEDTPETSGY